MIHADGTMDVLVDGNLEQRKYQMAFYYIEIARISSREAYRHNRAEPDLKEGEEVFYPVWNSVQPPVILTIK